MDQLVEEYGVDRRVMGFGKGTQRSDLERYGKELGLDMRKLRKALDTNKYAEVIDGQVALASRLKVPGTP